MSKLRVLTLVSLLIIAVGCTVNSSPTDQSEIIETAVASGLETALAGNVEATATTAPVPTETPIALPSPTPEPSATPVSTPTPEPTPGRISLAGKIAFESDRDGSYNEIYVMDADGSNQTRLTDNDVSGLERSYDAAPSWSPDGSKVAFDSTRNLLNVFGDSYIYVMDADGSNQTRLTSHVDQYGFRGDASASWSPDGSKIAFRSNRDQSAGITGIYVMEADGSNLKSLTENPARSEAPAWSPDGSKIAFQSDRDGNWEVYVMDADGSNQTNLSSNSADDGYPSWSPDGSTITFATDRDGNWEVYVMDADGSNQTNLTNNSANDDTYPSWSPEGSKIAFASDRDGNAEIYVMDADGSNQTNLTNNSANEFFPDWGPAR